MTQIFFNQSGVEKCRDNLRRMRVRFLFLSAASSFFLLFQRRHRYIVKIFSCQCKSSIIPAPPPFPPRKHPGPNIRGDLRLVRVQGHTSGTTTPWKSLWGPGAGTGRPGTPPTRYTWRFARNKLFIVASVRPLAFLTQNGGARDLQLHSRRYLRLQRR